MKTGSHNSSAKRAAVHRILLFPIFPADFPGQTPFFTPFAQKNDDNSHWNNQWTNIFPSCLALREMRRSHTMAITGLFRPDLSERRRPGE